MKNREKTWQDLLLSPALFWDTDASRIRLKTHARTIVERVVSRGTWPEFKAVVGHYGKEKVRDILVDLRYMDKRNLAFCSAFFNTPIEKFRCYTLKQSNLVHGNY